MARMRRGLVHAMAWSLATGAAVTLTWWGVRTVMAGTAYDPPRALALPADNWAAPLPSPVASSTQRPPSPSAKPSRPVRSAGTEAGTGADTGTGTSAGGGAGAGAGAATPGGEHRPSPYASSGEPARGGADGEAEPPASGRVKSYTVDGGRVAFDIGDVSAELVSATPDAGWQMQVWTQPSWIRVTFTQNGREVSVFCTWNGHPPMVQFDDR
ncbi:hypothetical protein [Streptomyces sp. NPDC050804]|uniref:hypothetical protein n=1 Tax=unclassified Streptomyces TaxID=2593676 RepID=UPI00342F24BA|nr:hypothetical protein OG214_25630 [Streptomyces sp. NBC_00872]